MIDTATEEVFPLATAAAKFVPARRAGRPTNVSCLYRWTQRGCRGVRLEYVQVGATRCTSREALARFFERLTAKSKGEAPPVRTAAHRAREIARATAELANAGLLVDAAEAEQEEARSAAGPTPIKQNRRRQPSATPP